MIGRIASLHMAPTPRAATALRGEGVPPARIAVTGNTVVDAQRWVCERHGIARHASGRGHLLVTMHRRENWGDDIEQACGAIGDGTAAQQISARLQHMLGARAPGGAPHVVA